MKSDQASVRVAGFRLALGFRIRVGVSVRVRVHRCKGADGGEG